MVCIVRDQFRRAEDEDVEHGLVGVAGGLEAGDVGVFDRAAIARDLRRKRAKRFEAFIRQRTVLADRRDMLVLDAGHLRKARMPRHAVFALVLVDDREIGDVALDRGKARLFGERPERAVRLERRRAFGENAVEVRHEPPGLADGRKDRL